MADSKTITDAFNNLEPAKQERVYQAAIGEFSELGYQKASMNTICKSARVSKGSLFHYFTSKSGLFQSILEIAISQVKSYLRDVRDRTKSENFFVRLEILMRAGFVFIDQHPHLAKIYFHLLHTNDSPSGSQLVNKLNRQSRKFLSEMLSEAVSSNELKKDIDLSKTAYFLNVLMEHLLRSYYQKFLASDLKIYQANKKVLDDWISDTIKFIRSGIEK